MRAVLAIQCIKNNAFEPVRLTC